MRPPSPPTFRPTLAERVGFGHVYSPAVRMILRDMERRPARALFTICGIAASLSILIAGTWWGDALNWLMDVELGMRERMHVAVSCPKWRRAAPNMTSASCPACWRSNRTAKRWCASATVTTATTRS
jgi:putative ABC transport system permease protein